ncbi:hypothetical protein [Gemmatimonas sp.]|jgi:hypothetical protein|uniref:hypothetical protein n=1 Tax=Gemmatimonas sp. TaxID=1962908 RepID=UPI0037C0C3FD
MSRTSPASLLADLARARERAADLARRAVVARAEADALLACYRAATSADTNPTDTPTEDHVR